ncbi:MAG: DUF5615 family PIN-like protein [Bacteroidetes bacterium]|nr:DUF5615 family PIN-like protein [Bacteroidota bacterium]
MKIKLDENIPSSLADRLEHFGHDVDTVYVEGLGGKSDDKVWEYTQREGRFLITQDIDFSDIRIYKPGTHNGILIVRLADPSRVNLIERISRIIEYEQVEKWHSCLVVATDRKIRIKRLARK